MSWTTVPMNALKAPGNYTFVGGPFGSELTTKDYVDEGVPVIRGNNLSKYGKFHDDDFVFVTDEKAVSLRSNTAYPGDLIFTQRGTLGQVGRIPEDARFDKYVVSQSQMKLTVDEAKVNPLFVYYYFCLPSTVQKILGSVSTSGVPHINLSTLKAFKIPLPEKQVQNQIVELVSPYDDLIENNRRRIGLLEEAARLLYREWFVYFRFPGHEHFKITNGLPDGWERIPPGRLVADHIGGGWGKDEPAGKETEPAFVIRGTDIPEVENGKIDGVGLRFHGPKQLESRILQPYDIIFEVSGGSTNQPIARTLILTPERLKQWDGNIICASFCKKFKMSTPQDSVFFYYHVREYRDRGDILVYQKESASSLKNFNFESFMSGYMVSLPPVSLRSMFFEQANDLLREQAVLSAQIVKLREARDLLLPRLMSGEIAV